MRVKGMCGFVSYFGSPADISYISNAQPYFDRIQHRGPDNTQRLTFPEGVHFTFHRLAIMDRSAAGDQPMRLPDDPDIILVCNGEIYNHKELATLHNFTTHSESDCEIILHLYKKLGIEQTVCELDGVFAFTLYDRKKGVVFVARDPFGVRPAFYGKMGDGIMVASEVKAISGLCDEIKPFPPGVCMSWPMRDLDKVWTFPYYQMPVNTSPLTVEAAILDNIQRLLSRAVQKRMVAHREIGCLLSGGLDSSLIAALVSSFSNEPIKTFSIGLKGSIDLHYAKMVAEHIGSEHHEVELTNNTP